MAAMSPTVETPPSLVAAQPDVTWRVAEFFPRQGQWSVDEYLALPTNRLVEYVDGRLEFPEMPTIPHQRLAKWLLAWLEGHVTAAGLGEAFPPPLPVYTIPERYREPDVFFATHAQLADRKYADGGVSLVMEVVSDDAKSRHRDLVTKRLEYAAAGIPEYWIVDPSEQTVCVLTLEGDAPEYAEHGVFGTGDTASSVLLAGFSIDVSELFAVS